MNGFKFLLFACAFVTCVGFVCVPCDAAEPCQQPRIVQQKGPWVLVQRGSERYWLYDAYDAEARLRRAGKKIVTGTFNIVGCAVESAGDIVIGTSSFVVGVGAEILDSGDCAVRCLLRIGRPCDKNRVPRASPARDKPPKVDVGEPSGPLIYTSWVRFPAL